jgi:3-hydroxyisobutyrate dehydrogenase-like beta-hydroxyacid dehydrogenase
MGLGRMGSLMAANLAKAGFQLTVFNRTSAVAEQFAADHPAEVAATPRDLAARSEILISMLADGDALIETYQGDEGVLAGLRAGALSIDMGTSGPRAVAEIRSQVEERGASMVDAPVSGSTPAAETATLLIMVGGKPADFERARPVLSVIGEPVPVGPPGAGASLKLVVNSILYAISQALAEGVLAAEAAGVGAETVLDVVARSAAGAPLVSYRRNQYLDPDNAPVTFTLDLAAKDLRLILDEAVAGGFEMPQLRQTLAVVERLIAAGEGSRDMGFVVEGMRRLSRTGSGSSAS